MPDLPPRPCKNRVRGCAGLSSDGSGWCPGCKPAVQASQDDRGSTIERGYDWMWRRLRERYLAANPMCEAQVACTSEPITRRIATQVHHKKPISEAPELRLEWSNLLAVCQACHVALERANRRAAA